MILEFESGNFLCNAIVISYLLINFVGTRRPQFWLKSSCDCHWGCNVPQQWACRNVKREETHCLIPNILIHRCRAAYWTIVQATETENKVALL